MMSDDLFDVLSTRGTPRCVLWSDPPSGLRAVLVIDSWALGPSAGGTRTRAYDSLAAAIDDAAGLARAMTLKCALGGVAAGGSKIVVLDHPGLRREAASCSVLNPNEPAMPQQPSSGASTSSPAALSSLTSAVVFHSDFWWQCPCRSARP